MSGLMDMQMAMQAWVDACADAAVTDDPKALSGVLAAYGERARRYHGRAHVAAVVVGVQDLAAEESLSRRDRACATFAAFWHDAIYDPRASDNEERSAALAATVLRDLGADGPFIAAVSQAIMATKTHVATTPTEEVLVDADLAILGAQSGEYATYTDQIRDEYAHVSDDDWVAGRRAVLQGFLDRDRIFATGTYRDRFEGRGAENLSGELARFADG